MKTFRKLIRDRVPDIIAANGERAVTRTLSEGEFIAALEAKLLEEVQEYRTGDSQEKQEELADIFEVIDAIVAASGYSTDAIRELQRKKREQRGGFEKRLFLESVE